MLAAADGSFGKIRRAWRPGRVSRKYRGPFLEFSHVAGRCSKASGARAAPRPELAIKCGLPAVAVAEDYGCSAAG